MKPTREQIQKATSEELRLWCAEMMGWREFPYAMSPEFGELWCPPGERMHLSTVRPLPYFSTDVGAAAGIVEALTADRKLWFGLDQHDKGYVAVFREIINSIEAKDRVWGCDDENAPLAICRAALLYWIEQPEVTA